MITDLEVYRAANQLLKLYDKDAELEAVLQADAMLELGDEGGYIVWKRISRAVEELLREEPRSNEQTH